MLSTFGGFEKLFDHLPIVKTINMFIN